ncbi:MAG: hypothetical protein WBP54_09525 [Pelodictyon phaeoclathratiforme]
MNKKILLLLTVFGGYTLLLLLLFYPLVFQSKMLLAPDTLIPQASTMALDRLQAQTGAYPLWQSWLFSGMPTVEAFSYLSGLYMPNVVFNLFHTDGIVLQLLHLAFAGLGLFLFLRQYGLTTFTASFGGALFMLNPYMSAMLVHGHGSQLMTVAYMPWMLWATMRLMQRGGLVDAGMLALLAGFQLQRSHVQIAWYSWMLLLLLAVVLFLSRRWVPAKKTAVSGRPPVLPGGGREGHAGGNGGTDEGSHKGGPYMTLRIFLLLVLALGCGIAMSASIYLPASEYAAYSVRGMAAEGGGSAWEYATLWSMHPLELLTFLVPGLFGFGGVTYWGFMPFTDFPHYAGIVVLLLAVAGAVIRRKEPMTWYYIAGALLALLLSFGRFFSPVFDLFYHFAPLFSRFRVPSMALIMLYLIISCLAAIGVNDLLQRQSERFLKPIRIGALLLAAFLLLFLAFEPSLESFFRSLFPEPQVGSFDLAFMVNNVRWENLTGSLWIVLLIASLFSGVLWLGIKGKLSHKITGLLLFLLALGDLLWMDIQIIYPSTSSLRSPVFADSRMVEPAFRHDDITRYLVAQKGPFRIYPAGPLFTENKFALFGIESVGGYHPAKLKLYEEFLAKTENLASLSILRMLNVGYIISPQPIEHPAIRLVKTGELKLASGPITVYVYGLQGTAPRAWFANRVIAMHSSDELFARLLEDQAPSGEAYVDGSLWKGTRLFATATVTSPDVKAESMVLKVAAPGEAFLVVSEIYYPLRWKVTVDGRETAVVKVNGLLRGVVIPAGSREVRFYYDRNGFETGRRISLGAFVLALLLMVAGGVIGGRFRQKGGK